MVQAEMQRQSGNKIKGIISSLYTHFESHGDIEAAHKVKQLGWKYGAKELTIAFCGHFSAGKSSLINTLVGEDILPSSPIPTSANLVRVKAGEEYAKVFFKQDIPWLYLPPYDYQAVKSHCLDGDEIQEIEISRKGSSLPENIVILDTPGIDSADDAHRIATESAIHLADLVFYVMDYNHVQSGVNFLFTKELQDEGKEVFLIVNQIDKHREEELSFESFKESVKSSFQSWGVIPEGIFFTSLKKSAHPENQYAELEKLIHSRLEDSRGFLENSTIASLRKVTNEYLRTRAVNQEEEREQLLGILAKNPYWNSDALSDQIKEIEDQLAGFQNETDAASKELDRKAGQILTSAYLMPFETRELAKNYLESEQPGFKVGFLFTEGKTNAEKKARKDAFLDAMSEKTKQQVDWHIRQFLLDELKEKGIRNEGLDSKARNFKVEVTPLLIEKPLKKGALLSGEYLLTYTDELAAEIKKAAREKIAEFKREYVMAVSYLTEKMAVSRKNELEIMTAAWSAKQKLATLEAELAHAKGEVIGLLEGDVQANESVPDGLFAREDEKVRVIRSEQIASTTAAEIAVPVPKAENPPRQEIQSETGAGVAARLKKAAGVVERLPGFANLAEDLRGKADKLENSSYTVALFGAFSAGKSSFSNALIGERVLPVSPNPTTASICRIKPVEGDYPHGSVVVKMKDPDSLLADVNKALKFFSSGAESLDEALEKTRELEERPFQGETAEKANLSFLHAFRSGYSAAKDSLGLKINTGIDEFADYVAKEDKSCFAEWIDLHYDCPLTRKGITLVDTPGADSINARHTGVAFDYIKNADAILFVTYYNHAFSRADREFLIQLGRVKEIFELDKMFFIVNAIDLAKNDEEKEVVLSYVKEQLGKFGIRNPSLHAVSALKGLEEKVTGEGETHSGFPEFEGDFFKFISEGLAHMAIASAKKELDYTLQRVSVLVRSAKEDLTNAEDKIRVLKEQKTKVNELIVAQSSSALEQRLHQEADELVHYCKQRVFLRFGDFFRESFNPSVLNSGSKNMRKSLDSALEDLLYSMGNDLAQEMRATALRIEKFAALKVLDFREGLINELAAMCDGLEFTDCSFPKPAGIEFPAALTDTDRNKFTRTLGLFKNPRDFFENNGKKGMQEQLLEVLSPEADSYLGEQAARLKEYGGSYTERLFELMSSNLNVQAENHFASIIEVLDGGIDVSLLEDSLKTLEQIAN
ncbi:dynamin family protein [Bacillus sp. FJAT-27445]|uniref:dynamin family protein n=1 Tax=Bacillus sp. FJAT-27445 TaxID=1679166 RepID=UPI0007440918|nr:dynamin family protein [Bacillus sp. FJAT-27445]